MNEKLEAAAARFDALSLELEKARAHCAVAAAHFRAQEVPRGCAHAIAIRGHLLAASELLDAFAKAHSAQATATQL